MTRRRRRLAVRVYLYTLSCVLVAVVLFVLTAIWLRPTPPERHVGPPQSMMTLYRLDGTLLAGDGAPGAEPLDAATLRELAARGDLRLSTGRHAAAIFEDGRMIGYSVSRPFPPGIPTGLFVATGVMLLLVTAVGSVLFARSLLRPLQRLEAAAEAFGRGERDARARLAERDEIGAVGGAFDRMADRVTGLVTAQRELMANVSHELRTPLSRIRVALDLAGEGDAATAREVMAEIDRDLAELERLVDEILTSMRLEMATAPLRTEEIRAGAIVEDAAQRFRAQHATHPLRVRVDEGLPPVRAEATLLRRALDNLLDNARKYSEPGSAIDLRASASGEGVTVAVEDAGIGIAPDDQAKLFTPFFRADRSRQRETGGVGLGLSLARKIVESHGGRIDVESAEGRGSTFRIWLPAA